LNACLNANRRPVSASRGASYGCEDAGDAGARPDRSESASKRSGALPEIGVAAGIGHTVLHKDAFQAPGWLPIWRAGQTKSPRPPTIVDEGQTASSWYHHDSSPARARDLHQFRTRRVKLSHVNGRGPWRTTAPNRRLVAKLGGVIWGRAAMALAAGASLSVRSASAPDLSSVTALARFFARRRRSAALTDRRQVRRGYAEGSMAPPHTSRHQPGQRSALASRGICACTRVVKQESSGGSASAHMP
jgi:hypothetical protein